MRFLIKADWWSGALTVVALWHFREGQYWWCTLAAVLAAWNYYRGWQEDLEAFQ